MQIPANGNRSEVGFSLAWTTYLSSGNCTAAHSSGLHTKRCTGTGKIRKRRAHENSKFPALDTAHHSETVRGSEEVLHTVASWSRNGTKVADTLSTGSHLVRLLSWLANYS